MHNRDVTQSEFASGLAVRRIGAGEVVRDQVRWACSHEQLGQLSARLPPLLAQGVAADDVWRVNE